LHYTIPEHERATASCLGRKKYLFAGSHEAAQRATMIYSFFATCKKHEVNPFQWLKYTLENIMTINHKRLHAKRSFILIIVISTWGQSFAL